MQRANPLARTARRFRAAREWSAWVYVWAWLCLQANACSSDAPSRISYGYAVTSSGQIFRVFGAGPAVRGANTTKGVQVSYLALSLDREQLDRDAAELVGAFGPELLLAREPTLTIRARYAQGKSYQPDVHEVAFQRSKDSWVRAPQPKSTPLRAAKQTAETPDESSFPFQAEKLAAAANRASAWLRVVDTTPLSAEAIEPMCGSFSSKLAGTPDFWPGLLERRRSLGLSKPRAELYRLQMSDSSPSRARGDSALVQFMSPSRSGAILERMVMYFERKHWCVAGYAFEPVPVL